MENSLLKPKATATKQHDGDSEHSDAQSSPASLKEEQTSDEPNAKRMFEQSCEDGHHPSDVPCVHRYDGSDYSDLCGTIIPDDSDRIKQLFALFHCEARRSLGRPLPPDAEYMTLFEIHQCIDEQGQRFLAQEFAAELTLAHSPGPDWPRW